MLSRTLVVTQLAVLVVGGSIAAVHVAGSDAGFTPLPPSVQTLPFSTTRPPGPPTTPTPETAIPAGADASPDAALATFLAARGRGDLGLSWALLDTTTRKGLGSLAAWTAEVASRSAPTGATVTEVTAYQPAPTEVAAAADEDRRSVTATVDYVPRLDDFIGYLPARRTEVWTATREAGGWRVGGGPVRATPVITADPARAEAVVQQWLAALAACDDAAAAALEVPAGLLGESVDGFDPCATGLPGSTGPLRALPLGPEVAPYLAAFGADVAVWARVVPVTVAAGESAGGGAPPTTEVAVAVAPLGEDWRIFGITRSTEGGAAAG